MTHPTPIQQKTIPVILQGKSVCGIAATGQGKTAAFALPIIQRLVEDPFGIFAVVLTPTRELANQIHEQFEAFGAPFGVTSICLTGGESLSHGAAQLESAPHILVATPGRLAYSLSDEARSALGRARFAVLDEADRLLGDPRLRSQVATVLGALPPPAARASLLFTATLTPELQTLAEQQNIAIMNTNRRPREIVATLRQEMLLIPQPIHKPVWLAWLLCTRFGLMPNCSETKVVLDEDVKGRADRSAIIFAANVERTIHLEFCLRNLGFKVVGIHGMMKQRARMASMHKFKSGTAAILVATDVASRGLDIPTVDMVINFDVPSHPDDYVHRVGRTARIGRQGYTISLVERSDVDRVQQIEAITESKLDTLTMIRDYSNGGKDVPVSEDLVLTNFLSRVTKAGRESRLQMVEWDYFKKLDQRKERRAKDREDDVKRGIIAPKFKHTRQ
eukprot:gnl/Dysnectes_brevis/2349_a2772_1464.p1 GENE.gnl/Dysnectes_brevis/2349_a2772_1464~~gnl/Dysnectes_brevis/2349_a2772_1464.p1  ORF type:complete len:479 (-),score=124.08 gnl/Dysnectes_brevis/2349_a2772_1464:74-1417(-)